MTPTLPAARSGSYLPYFLLFLPLAVLGWAFWPTLTELVHTWISDPQYSHGFLVPVYAGILLWLRRAELKGRELRPSWWGLLVLATGVAMRLRGGYYYYVWYEQFALVACIAGLWFTAGGMTALRWGWPALAFLSFMIPLPYSLSISLTGPLQWIATLSSTFVMQVIGLPALSEGNLIKINDAQINVVEACSGLRMTVVFFALAAAVVLVSRRPLLDKLIVLASAAPIAILSNIVRVTATGVLHQLVSGDVANAFFHDVAGWFMMPLALGLLWGELRLLSALFIDLPAPPPVRGAREPLARRVGSPSSSPKRTPLRQRPASTLIGKERGQTESVAAAEPGLSS